MCVLVMAVLAKTATAQNEQNIRPVDVTVFQGQRVMFNCSGTQVSWLRDIYQSGDSGTGDQKLFQSSPRYISDENKFEIVGQYYLAINNVDARTDGGTYVCDTNEDQSYTFNVALVVLGNISELSVYVVNTQSNTVKCLSVVSIGRSVSWSLTFPVQHHFG